MQLWRPWLKPDQGRNRMKFIIEIRDYEQGGKSPISTSDIEDAVKYHLDLEGSGGTVIVEEVQD